MVDIVVVVGDIFKLSPTPVATTGREAQIDSVPNWWISDTSVVEYSAVPGAGGVTSAALVNYFHAVAPGACYITATADALIGAGTSNVTGRFDVTVVPKQADHIEFACSIVS